MRANRVEGKNREKEKEKEKERERERKRHTLSSPSLKRISTTSLMTGRRPLWCMPSPAARMPRMEVTAGRRRSSELSASIALSNTFTTASDSAGLRGLAWLVESTGQTEKEREGERERERERERGRERERERHTC